jgi:hypothetical protein
VYDANPRYEDFFKEILELFDIAEARLKSNLKNQVEYSKGLLEIEE